MRKLTITLLLSTLVGSSLAADTCIYGNCKAGIGLWAVERGLFGYGLLIVGERGTDEKKGCAYIRSGGGTDYFGQIISDKREGKGAMINRSGELEVGIWKNDKLIESMELDLKTLCEETD